MTITVCIWAVVVFIGVNAQGHLGWAALARWGYIPDQFIYRGAYWGALTNAFVHIEPLHLFFNLYWIWILGGALERTVGSFRWTLFVLLAAFVSSALSLATEGFGIGLSGVGYALFGFGWMTRRRYPEFARTVSDRTIQIFLLWGVLCVVGTYAHVMNIGNVAHGIGLLFGVAVGATVSAAHLRLALAALLTVLTSAAMVSLFFSPLSMEWNAHMAETAHDRGRFSEAIRYYQRSLNQGADPKWVWGNLARIYGYENSSEYRAALTELRRYNEADAKKVTTVYGDPDHPIQEKDGVK